MNSFISNSPREEDRDPYQGHQASAFQWIDEMGLASDKRRDIMSYEPVMTAETFNYDEHDFVLSTFETNSKIQLQKAE